MEFRYLSKVKYVVFGDYSSFLSLIVDMEEFHGFNPIFKVGLKAYEIVALMFLGITDLIPLKIDTLRKHAYKFAGGIRIRLLQFVRLFNIICSLGFRKNVKIDSKRYLELLNLLIVMKKYSWNPLGFEILRIDEIVFNVWFSETFSKEDLQLYKSRNDTEQSTDED
jgi:hypothetical protein